MCGTSREFFLRKFVVFKENRSLFLSGLCPDLRMLNPHPISILHLSLHCGHLSACWNKKCNDSGSGNGRADLSLWIILQVGPSWRRLCCAGWGVPFLVLLDVLSFQFAVSMGLGLWGFHLWRYVSDWPAPSMAPTGYNAGIQSCWQTIMCRCCVGSRFFIQSAYVGVEELRIGGSWRACLGLLSFVEVD